MWKLRENLRHCCEYSPNCNAILSHRTETCADLWSSGRPSHCLPLEGFPTLFYSCPTNMMEGVAQITEAWLKREVNEGKIIDFQRSEVGFDVIRMEAMNSKQNKGKHCLLIGTIQALQSLKSLAPPMSILIKPMTEESITTFSPEQLSPDHAGEVDEEVMALEDQHLYRVLSLPVPDLHETLMGQIEDIVKKKRKQAWGTRHQGDMTLPWRHAADINSRALSTPNIH